MNILILKGFNNYFNRIALKYPNLATYQTASEAYFNFANVNFNPADGVSTELIIGNETQQISENNTTKPLDWEFSGAPDYLICYESSGSTVSIKSRWYVIECDRTRNGQYRLLLKRDVISDHYDDVVNATCFVEKGAVESVDDSAIFNKEPIETNQIKSTEFLLKDETQCGWVVGYVAKDRWNGSSIVDTEFDATDIPDDTASDDYVSETYSTLSEFNEAHADIIGTLGQVLNIELTIKAWILQRQGAKSRERENEIKLDLVGRTATFADTGAEKKLSAMSESDGLYTDFKFMYTAARWDYRDFRTKPLYANLFTDEYLNFIKEQIGNNEGVTIVDDSTIKKFYEYVNKGKIIKIGSKYYEVVDEYSNGWGKESSISDENNFNLYSTPYNETTGRLDTDYTQEGSTHIVWHGNPVNDTFKLKYSLNRHKLYLVEKFVGLKAKMPTTIPVLKDAPYYMFAIPFSDDLALFEGNTLHCTTKQSVAINAAQAIVTKNGGGTIYDVQLLPYCPVRNIIKTDKVTGHATISEGTFDEVLKPLIGTTLTQYIVKLNHQYTIKKGIDISSVRIAGLRSDSPIYIKIGDGNIENPSEVLIAHRIEIRRSDMDDASSSVIIAIYENKTDRFPKKTIDYNTYANSTDLIGIYCTDVCQYPRYISGFISGFTWEDPNSSSGFSFYTSPKSMLNDYIYYEDYYLSKIDISDAIYSDIVKVEGGVEGDIVSTIFWCPESKFTFNKSIDDYYLLAEDGETYIPDVVNNLINSKVKRGATIQDIKFKNQADMLRLASPNYSNFFDMSIERNLGISYINVDCTYKPYSPYIHLNPDFKGLYGGDFDDVRGLICGGDFSIALTNDAWSTYQLQNKNYQAIFDRQIQNIETSNAIQNYLDKWQAGAGALTGTVAGAAAGAMSGGGIYGAVAGAVVGGTASILGGAADVRIKQQLRDLQLSTNKDIFSMQLENIKALPQGLAKTNYLTNNNKLFPFLEFYTCTAIEEQAVRDYITYNGMTINRIGQISQFQDSEVVPYIKAKLIRINTIEDAHQVEEIARELSMGYYIPRPDTLLPDEDEE